MKKLLALVLAVVMMLSIASVASADSLQTVLDAGVLKVGIDPTFAPLTFKDEAGNYIGYDIDLANAAAAKLGLTVEFVEVDWANLEAVLEDGTVDCIWSGLGITPERSISMVLSDAYLPDNTSILVPADIEAMDEMGGMTVAVQIGSSTEELLCTEEFSDFVGDITLIGVKDYEVAIRGLLFDPESLDPNNPAHQVAVGDMALIPMDAVVISSLVANYEINTNEALADYTVIENLAEDNIGIGFAKGNYKLCGAIEEALFELAEEGELAKISEKWFGTDITLIGK